MRPLAFAPLLVLAVPCAATAQDSDRGRLQIFVSPAGEPFRTAANDTDPLQVWFEAADKDGDGKLTYAEFEADLLRFFAELDTDKDGEINSVERQRYEKVVAPETHSGTWRGGIESAPKRASRADGVGDADSHIDRAPKRRGYNAGGIGAGRYDLLGIPQPIADMDALIRGRVTRSDAVTAAQDRFARLDLKNQGFLTLPELMGYRR